MYSLLNHNQSQKSNVWKGDNVLMLTPQFIYLTAIKENWYFGSTTQDLFNSIEKKSTQSNEIKHFDWNTNYIINVLSPQHSGYNLLSSRPTHLYLPLTKMKNWVVDVWFKNRKRDTLNIYLYSLSKGHGVMYMLNWPSLEQLNIRHFPSWFSASPSANFAPSQEQIDLQTPSTQSSVLVFSMIGCDVP